MAQFHWKNAVSANFATQSDWNPATIPGVNDDAIIDAVGKYTVTVAADATVHTFDTANNVTLAIAAGKTLVALGAVNDGKITVADGGTLEISGLDNIGSLSLNGSKNPTSIEVDGAITVLGGNGTVTLGNNANNQIISNGSNGIFDNVDDTITGAGRIGDAGNHLSLINDHSGTINASGSVALVIKTGNTVVNNGLMEATGSGGLHIEDAVNQLGGGTLAANGAKAHVDLDNADITGGTLASSGGGLFKTVTNDSATLIGKVELDGTLDVVDNSFLQMNTFLGGTGTIALQGKTGATSLIVEGNSLTVAAILMSDSAENFILTDGSNHSFDNAGMLSGAGSIGDSHLTLTNSLFGTVDATGKNALIIKAATVDNDGVMEATGKGTLEIQSDITGSSGSIIEALDTGRVVLTNGVDIDNTKSLIGALHAGAQLDVGTVAAGGSAGIDEGDVTIVAGAQLNTIVGPNQATPTSLTLKDNTVANAGTINIADNSNIILNGTNTTVSVVNNGTIALQGATKATKLIIDGADGAVTAGGGKITLTDSAFNSIVSNGTDTVFENVDNTISGAGTIGDAHLDFNNDVGGIINANGANNALILDAKDFWHNNGLIELTGKGGLTIESDISQNSNTGSLVDASKSGILTISALVNGGIVKATVAGATIKLDNGSIFGGSISTVAGSSIVSVAGTSNDASDVHNAGTVTVTNNSLLAMGGTNFNAGTVNVSSTGQSTVLDVDGKFDGHGKIVMSDNTNNLITSGQGVTIVNAADLVTFGGSVTVGDVLQLNITDGLTFNVTETVVASAGDTLATLAGKFASEINLDPTLAQHSIQAAAASNFLGVVQPGDVGNGTFVTPIVPGGATETIMGSFAHLGGGSEDAQPFENYDNTVTGAGTIGHSNDLTVTNDAGGVINANGTQQMVIDTGNYDVINSGLIEATGAGGLKIESAVLNQGHLVANNSTLEIDGSLTGFGGALIAGAGVLHLAAHDNFQDITFAAGSKGEFILDHSAGYVGRIIGFGANTSQSIDLTDINFAGATANWTQSSNGVSGILHVSDGTHSADLTLVGHYTNANFVLHDDNGHVLITDPPVPHAQHDLLL